MSMVKKMMVQHLLKIIGKGTFWKSTFRKEKQQFVCESKMNMMILKKSVSTWMGHLAHTLKHKVCLPRWLPPKTETAAIASANICDCDVQHGVKVKGVCCFCEREERYDRIWIWPSTCVLDCLAQRSCRTHAPIFNVAQVVCKREQVEGLTASSAPSSQYILLEGQAASGLVLHEALVQNHVASEHATGGLKLRLTGAD
eukprot:4447258-Amphidinium_carterae.1